MTEWQTYQKGYRAGFDKSAPSVPDDHPKTFLQGYEDGLHSRDAADRQLDRMSNSAAR
jgi:hypothetical protein